jgi:ketosteroid isomerase-like protein
MGADLEADREAVREANLRFYRAFESGDIDAMSDVWHHGEQVVCTHPGWTTLRGWAAVAASWFALFHNGQHLQFIVTSEHAEVEGDLAWVTCDENILAGDGGSGGTVAALNLYRRQGDRWLLLAHHGSPVARS